MDYIRKIKDKSELFNEDGTLKNYDLSNLDISDIDLSDINPAVWEHARFYHTNFKNTGIKFYPQQLASERFNDMHFARGHSLAYCNFENCDLSYLKDEDMFKVVIKGTNFRNTNLKINFRNNKVFSFTSNEYLCGMQSETQRVNLSDGTILPTYYEHKLIDYFDYAIIDVDFLENNPYINISSGKLFEIISNYFKHMYQLDEIINVSEEVFKKYHLIFCYYLEYDRQGKLKRFYEDMKPYLISKEKYLQFFRGLIKNIHFEELDLTYLDKKMIVMLLFENCNIDRLKLGVSYKEIIKESRKNNKVWMKGTIINKLSIPTTLHDWQNASYNQIISSNITMQTNLYLEFERICNMHCQFCRNERFDKCTFDFNKIQKTLKSIYSHLNKIVIGGGEPLLYLDELKELSNILSLKRSFYPQFFVATNGSFSPEIYWNLINTYNYNFYFSRHAIEDVDNKKIFGDKFNKIMTTAELQQIIRKDKHIMCCTCFKGGVDTVGKMLNYVKYVENIGFSHILFQNLHQEDEHNIVINVDEIIMLETISKLREQGFVVSYPIISNSNYVLYILKKEKFEISFKMYKKREEILDLWSKSPKRCFDLSIDPSGNLYETWNQQDDTNILRKNLSK